VTDFPTAPEAGVISRTAAPHTRRSLAGDLRRAGVRPGEVLIVHSSLSALGWVVGGEVAVVTALLDALGPEGTLIVPAQSFGNSDPAVWSRPPVPEQWWPVIRANMPPYDPATTPTRGMGRIVEAVRTWPGAVRSAHPQASFAGIGARAGELLARHDLDCRFGARSPLPAIEAAGGRVLLLGVSFDSCTCLHLAETRVPDAPTEELSCSVATPDGPAWVTFTDTVAHEGDFVALGTAFTATGGVRLERVGAAEARIFGVAEVVAFATGWIQANRLGPWPTEAFEQVGADGV
jgi:aminoglycoside 3-N-acetyltransferase